MSTVCLGDRSPERIKFDRLSREVSGELERSGSIITSLAQTVATKLWFWPLLMLPVYTIRLMMLCRRLIAQNREMAELLSRCPDAESPASCEECEMVKQVRQSLSRNAVVITAFNQQEREFIRIIKENQLPSFIVRPHEWILADMEDLAENCYISADDEIDKLVKDIASKHA